MSGARKRAGARTAGALICLSSLLLAACTTNSGSPAQPSPTPTPSHRPIATPTQTQTPAPAPEPVRFRADAAFSDVRHLAGRIGPRLATGAAYREAGSLVAQRFEDLGYDVARQRFAVPAGDSWGVPVDAGRSFNVVATPEGFDEGKEHLVVGAHLDTVAAAPGAEDNASGVAVVLELARLAAREDPRLPTVFVAFGAEEPRGTGDDLHHFGSQHYVREMSRRERGAMTAMVSLDRVGVGATVPVCTGPISPSRVQGELVDAGRRVGVPTLTCENTASDHWSFEKAGATVARLGSTSYAAYHSAADVPAVVDQRQLGRTGRLAWAWLSGGR